MDLHERSDEESLSDVTKLVGGRHKVPVGVTQLGAEGARRTSSR